MNETENQPTTVPEEETAPVEPIQHGQTEAGEEIISAPVEEQATPPPGKPKRVAEKFGTRRWWVYFLIGVLAFFLINFLSYWGFDSAISGIEFGEGGSESILACIMPFAFLAFVVILLVRKMYPVLLGYLGGYVLNFIISAFLGVLTKAVCGVPFFMPGQGFLW